MSARRFDDRATNRAIRDDRSLTSTEKSLLWCAVTHADGTDDDKRDAGRVRMSLEGIAKGAGYERRAAILAFKRDHVLRYFVRVDRSTRSVGLWFHLSPPETVTSDRGSRVTSDPGSPIETVTSDRDASTSDSDASTSDRGSHHLRSHLRNSPSGGSRQRGDTEPSSPVADESDDETTSSSNEQHIDWSGPHWTHDVFVELCRTRATHPHKMWRSLVEATEQRRRRDRLATVADVERWYGGGPHELPREGSGLRPLPPVDASLAQSAAADVESTDDGTYSQAEFKRQLELLREKQRAAAERQINAALSEASTNAA